MAGEDRTSSRGPNGYGRPISRIAATTSNNNNTTSLIAEQNEMLDQMRCDKKKL
ncbi:unnamed protein product, partial [Amoebophrya sp. A25]|eukprot:GSA25T00022933001.1